MSPKLTPEQRRSITQLVFVFAGCAWLVVVEDDYLRRCGGLLFVAAVIAGSWPIARAP